MFSNIFQWRTELEEILTTAADDTDQWVAMVGDLLRTIPSTGAINTSVDESHRFFHDILTDLRKLGELVLCNASLVQMHPKEKSIYCSFRQSLAVEAVLNRDGSFQILV